MKQTLMATFGAAMLALAGGAGETGSAEAHGRATSRATEYVSISVPYSHVTYASHSRDRYTGGRHGNNRYFQGHPSYGPTYGKAYGYWKKHPYAYSQTNRRHEYRHHGHGRR